MGMQRTRRAFSRIDLVAIIVSTIILVCGVALPGLSKQRQQARLKQCQDNLLGIGSASAGWSLSHRDDLPSFSRRVDGPTSRHFATARQPATSDLEAVQDEAAEYLRLVTGHSEL